MSKSDPSPLNQDASRQAISKAIYIGPFAHSLALAKLEICSEGAIGVDEAGTIAFVARGAERVKKALTQHEWRNARRVQIDRTGFFFPGFIGMSSGRFASHDQFLFALFREI